MKFWLCKQIERLDRIPRYGRLYTWSRDMPPEQWEKSWEWQKLGRWGSNFLDSIGWLMWYYDTIGWECGNCGTPVTSDDFSCCDA